MKLYFIMAGVTGLGGIDRYGIMESPLFMFLADTDEKLASRAARGEEWAFSRLYDRYADKIFRYCFFQLRDEALSQDLMQDTFVAVIRSLKTFGDKGSFKSWLYTIAKRQVFAHLREKYRFPKAVLGDWIAQPVSAKPDESPAKERKLMRLLLKLKPKDRELLELTYLKGLTSKETAAVTGRTPESVRVAVHRAVKKLRGETL